MALSLTYLQSAVSGTDGSSFTFSAQNISTAASDRYVIAGISFRAVGTVTFSSVTIGGVSATLHSTSYNTVGGNSTGTCLAIAAVPTGTTADVVVNLSGTALRCGHGLWRVTGLASATPTDGSGSTASAPTYAIDVVAGGFAIGCAYSADTATASWTGITEKYDEAVEGAGSRHSGASDVFATTQTNTTLTCTFTSSVAPSGSFASWEAAADTVRLLSLTGVGT